MSTTRLLYPNEARVRQNDLAVSRARHFLGRIIEIRGRNELSLLDVYGPARTARRHEQVGLPAEKRWNLEDIDELSRFLRLRCFVNVRQHRNSELPYLAQYSQPFLDPRPPVGVDVASIRLIERRFENIRPSQLADTLRNP